MNTERLIRVIHKNDLSSYIGNWKTMMVMLKQFTLEKVEQVPIQRHPTSSESYSFNAHAITVLLSFLDKNLRILEHTPLRQFNNQAYAESLVFFKTFFIVFHVLLDDLAGVIEFFYKKNESKAEIPPRFDDLFKKAEKRKLPEHLSNIILNTQTWFPEIKRTRDDIIHYYDSVLLSFTQTKNDENIVGHFHVGGRKPYAYEDSRAFLGGILSNYQILLDGLLNHLDNKFTEWYKFKPHRDFNILEGSSGIILWWAWKFGNYRNPELQVIENTN